MYKKEITYCLQPAVVACDGKCEKAWGFHARPKEEVGNALYLLADDELEIAPIDPETYEGGHAKPTSPDEIFNKWCVRECERCSMTKPNEPIKIKDFSKRVFLDVIEIPVDSFEEMTPASVNMVGYKCDKE